MGGGGRWWPQHNRGESEKERKRVMLGWQHNPLCRTVAATAMRVHSVFIHQLKQLFLLVRSSVRRQSAIYSAPLHSSSSSSAVRCLLLHWARPTTTGTVIRPVEESLALKVSTCSRLCVAAVAVCVLWNILFWSFFRWYFEFCNCSVERNERSHFPCSCKTKGKWLNLANDCWMKCSCSSLLTAATWWWLMNEIRELNSYTAVGCDLSSGAKLTANCNLTGMCVVRESDGCVFWGGNV